ncbi:ATP-dependent helicase HrpB [Nitzschia inconspicua]|uniref:ATP-dependent helicase HrpB n=1 Tax=Nitzschia inconspicua TaxID=303405 RepID=A0A9K3M6C5_9STRA|nr:ATP-dependent helicase HrpB [Nitzschia inconspicua]
MTSLGGIRKAFLQFLPLKDKEAIDEFVARIQLDQNLITDTSDLLLPWPPWVTHFARKNNGASLIENKLSVESPDGSMIPIKYAGDGPPTATAKLQQFFGTTKTSTVGPKDNAISITISMLSPAGRLLAKTSDLPFFWSEVYPSIRFEMRGRYPKHP